MVSLAKNQSEFLKIFLAKSAIEEIWQQSLISNDLTFYCGLEAIFLPIVAMLAGEELFSGIMNFQQVKLHVLKRYLPFEYKITEKIVNAFFTLLNFKGGGLVFRDLVNTMLQGIRCKSKDGGIALAVNKEKITLKIHDDSPIKNSITRQFGIIKSKQNPSILNFKENEYIVFEFLLISLSNDRYRVANNMLVLRGLVIDIIKLQKVRKCSKLGINVIRRLASNNDLILIDLIDNWVKEAL